MTPMIALSLAELLALLAIVLRAGALIAVLNTMTSEVAKLRDRVDLHSSLIAKAIEQIDGVEQRVNRIEHRLDTA